MLVEYGIDGGVDKEGSREKWISFIHYPGIIPCVLSSPFTVYPRRFFAAKLPPFNHFSIEGWALSFQKLGVQVRNAWNQLNLTGMFLYIFSIKNALGIKWEAHTSGTLWIYPSRSGVPSLVGNSYVKPFFSCVFVRSDFTSSIIHNVFRCLHWTSDWICQKMKSCIAWAPFCSCTAQCYLSWYIESSSDLWRDMYFARLR